VNIVVNKEEYKEMTFRVFGAILMLLGLIILVPVFVHFVLFLLGFILVIAGLYFFFIHHTEYALNHHKQKGKKKT